MRLAKLGLIDGWRPDVVISDINHGANLGDDITYSGTVAAALEAIVLGLPGIAASQQSSALELDFRHGLAFDFALAAEFSARLVGELDTLPLPHGTLLNANFPGTVPDGVEVARLGRRVYADELELVERSGARRCYQVYGQAIERRPAEPGSDVAALARRRVAHAPAHDDLAAHRSRWAGTHASEHQSRCNPRAAHQIEA